MNDKKKWNRRLAPHIYDYNYKVGESYYAPQTEYIENRDFIPRRKAPPPEAQTFAERYVDRPIYGSTRGLPYDESESTLGKPLVRRRAVSVGRARSREPEIDDAPSNTRLGRSRERKVSFNMNDFPSLLDNELNFQIPATRYRKSSEKIASEEDFDINPKMKRELEEEFKRIKNEFKKADSVERTSVRSLPRATQYEETVYNADLGVPGRRKVKREEVNYTLPPSGAKVHKSSYSESTKFESSKPPRAPRISRFSSVENDIDFKLPSRLRKFSASDIDDDDFKLKYFTPKPNSRNRTAEEETRFQQNLSLRERRRKEDSEELSTHISNLINRMKSHDSEEGYKFSRNIRSTSLDPYDYEPRARARVQARAHQFTYGVSK
ncbi:uncharacterized protein [Macrobrachium rosenbergii]|uniref:uncharacterized protein n=2 Tax=cellular organisms TaxID=131567 RepID=UPI0034D3B46D